MRSAVLAPLAGRAGSLGVLAVAMGPSDRKFGDDDVELVPIIGRLAGLAIENIEALQRQRLIANRLRRAGRVAVSVNAADDIAQIGTAVIDVAGSELGAASGLLYLTAGDDLQLVASSGNDSARFETWRTIPLAASAPAADACRTGAPVMCATAEEIVARYRALAELEHGAEQALLAAPLTLAGRPVGAVHWSFDHPHRFSEDDLSFVELVGEQVVAAIVRTRASKSEAESAARLTTQGLELSASRSRLAALAAADVIGIVAGHDDRITEANGMFLEMLGLPHETVATGDVSAVDLTPPEWRDVDAAMVVEMRTSGRLEPYEKEFWHVDGSRVPVLVGGGALTTDPFLWIMFVVDLRARRSAEAAAQLANERLVELLEEQRRIADVLQASLLPTTLPSIEGVELHAEHWPEASGQRVGGDFYDVFPIPDDRWGVLIGDVCGKGVEAAAVTATARHTARAAAMHLRAPDAVLQWVHEAVLAHPLDTFCTVAFAVIETTPGDGVSIEVCLGGHPAGIVCHADRSVERLGAPGTLLGIVPPALSTTTHRLLPGDVVLFYTDGVTDAPGDEAMSEDELSAWLCEYRDLSPEQIGHALRHELARRRPNGLRDDVASVIMRVCGNRN